MALLPEPARKGMLEPCSSTKRTDANRNLPEIGAPSTMDVEGRIITLNLTVSLSSVYAPNAGDGLKRLDDRQVWDAKYAECLAT